MMISKTRSFCCDCQTEHDALFENIENQVYFTVDCPLEKKSVIVSKDAELFLSIREKSYCDYLTKAEKEPYSWENFIEITNDCNFHCPTCFVTSEDRPTYYLDFSQFMKRLKYVKQKKLVSITISGGEPTLHPHLFRMIKAARKAGITVKILTNGSKLGSEKNYAKQLKKCGIEYCFIQFDSLRQETCKKIRENNDVQLKINALNKAKAANHYIGVNTLVFPENLSELGELLPFLFSYAPHLSLINLICPVKASGRFEISTETLVDRESIIKEIIQTGVIPGLTASHFHPLPKFNALGINLHPDCLAITIVAKIRDRLLPMDDLIDFDKLYRKLAKNTLNPMPNFGSFLFMFHLTMAIKPKNFRLCLKLLLGMVFKKGDHSFFIITVEQFMNEVYQDLQRLKFCTTANVNQNGTFVPGCVFNHPDKRRDKNCRLNGMEEGILL